MRQASVNIPQYKEIGIDDFDCNPLISHLKTPPDDDASAFLALGLRINFDPGERDLSTFIRRLRAQQLRRFFVPVMEAQRQALIGITSQVFDSYVARNPFTPSGQAILYGGPNNVAYRPTISFIGGHSGSGKSTLMDRILAYIGNQVTRHERFRDQPFPETQILWLRRNVPELCTLGNLCGGFGDYTDEVLGTNLYGGVFSKIRSDRQIFLHELRKIITNHHVGLLVLDEFQNLSLLGVGAKKIIALLVNLRDDLGVPIVVIGTYKALSLLEKDMSVSRRLCEGGFYDMALPKSANDEAWHMLCKRAWQYQWVRNPADFSDDIAQALFDVSQGNSGIMLTAFLTAQQLAIGNPKLERVDANLLYKVYEERMSPLHPAIAVLRSGDPLLIDRFEDLYRNAYPTIDQPDGRVRSTAAAPPATSLEDVDVGPSGTKESSTDRRKGKRDQAKERGLSQDQIRKLVTADSMQSLITVLEK